MPRELDTRSLTDPERAQADEDADEYRWVELSTAAKVERLNRRLKAFERPVAQMKKLIWVGAAAAAAALGALVVDVARNYRITAVTPAPPPVYNGGPSLSPDRVAQTPKDGGAPPKP